MHIKGILEVVFFKWAAQDTSHEAQLQDRDAPKPTQVFGLSGRIGQKRPHSSSAGPARSKGHASWKNETSTGTIEGAHRASTRISNLCACAPFRQREPTPRAQGTRTPPHQHSARTLLRILLSTRLSRSATCTHQHHARPRHTCRAPRTPGASILRVPARRAPTSCAPHTPGAHVPRATRSACPAFDTPLVPRQAPHVPR